MKRPTQNVSILDLAQEAISNKTALSIVLDDEAVNLNATEIATKPQEIAKVRAVRFGNEKQSTALVGIEAQRFIRCLNKLNNQ
jgi:hypothetical protein